MLHEFRKKDYAIITDLADNASVTIFDFNIPDQN